MRTIELGDACLTSPPSGDQLLVCSRNRVGFAMGDRLEAVFAPAALKRTKLVATADRRALLRAICIKNDIVGRVFGELTLAAHGGDESAAAAFRRAQVRCVHKYQPLCQGSA